MADDNGIYKNDGCPTNYFFYNNGSCIKAHKDENGWKIKIRESKKYVDKVVDSSKVYALVRTYRKHSIQTNFINIICRMKNVMDDEWIKVIFF